MADGQYTFQLTGNLFASTLPTLNDQIDEVIPIAPEGVTLDMAGVEFIDSLGLGTLITWHQRCIRKGTWFAITDLRPKVLAAVQQGKLDRLLDIRSSPSANTIIDDPGP